MTRPGRPQRLAALATGPLGLAGTLAVLLGIMEFWRREQYSAGWGDHFVLSPEGLSWAIPGAFQGDWFMESAPQPHWFFDILTFVGSSLGILSTTYALFWAVGLLAFGGATALLAYRFTPGNPWLVGAAFTLVISITPWMVGGTGSPVIAQALPAVTSANLVYLAIAGLLSHRRWVTVVAAPLVALVHVQQGSVIAIILAAVVVADALQQRRVDLRLGVALGATVALVVFGLLLRPVASNLDDFVEVCDTVIAYHCAAHLWSTREVVSTLGLILLTACSWFLVPRRARLLWLCTVGLALVGYTLGFAADLLRVPLLGTLAQGVNVYRLGAVLVPFALWGAMVPVLRPELDRAAVIRFGTWGVGLWCLIQSPFGFTDGMRTWLFAAAVAAVAVFAVVANGRRRHSRRSVVGVSVSLLAGVFLFAAALGGTITVRPPDIRFIADPATAQWGADVREVVEPGETIIAPPLAPWVKLVTQRAVVVDCKNIPYGGEPWREWKERIESFGGLEQCVVADPIVYNELSARRLIELADTFDSDVIAVDPGLEQAPALAERGWIRIQDPVDGRGLALYRRPE